MIFHLLVVILGLCAFEVISSVDNAIINAHVLRTMPERFRRIFLFWGIFFAVFVIRGLLPFAIVWLANPGISFGQLFHLVFSSSETVEAALAHSKSILLTGGGVYLLFVFLAWLFLEEKKYAFLVEHFLHRQGMWFYAVASLVFTVIVYLSIRINPALALAASIGATAFFVTDGFKKSAEEKEQAILRPSLSAWSKLFYLEALDASFSIDGVIGAFAFTISIPLIILGNGLGAFIVRDLTIRGVNFISKFAYLKNGAMYSIGVLGLIMILEGFGRKYPFWLAPFNTFLILAIFFYLSYRELREAKEKASSPISTA